MARSEYKSSNMKIEANPFTFGVAIQHHIKAWCTYCVIGKRDTDPLDSAGLSNEKGWDRQILNSQMKDNTKKLTGTACQFDGTLQCSETISKILGSCEAKKQERRTLYFEYTKTSHDELYSRDSDDEIVCKIQKERSAGV
eukprot:TRINITY_DN1004_c0_g1_i4.p1 TRINITY_DN1004_c0_g1~~TRINITY_DN1004_c0_g1_i4.p1  ORF type:complete len:140 (+),score=16.19 TRINITY_DN1004_c0_g1_i4:173-592(+)